MLKMRGVNLSKYALLWVSIILLPPALLALPTMANADGGDQSRIRACVNPSGLTRIVGEYDKCHPSETPFEWSKEGGGGFTVVDNTGKTVGRLLGVTSNDVNAVSIGVLTVGTDRVLVAMGPSGFSPPEGLRFYYQGPNCSGTPLTDPTTNRQFFPYMRVVGTVGYYGGREIQTIQAASFKYFFAVGEPQCITWWAPRTFNLTPIKTVDVSGFTPPFSVK